MWSCTRYLPNNLAFFSGIDNLSSETKFQPADDVPHAPLHTQRWFNRLFYIMWCKRAYFAELSVYLMVHCSQFAADDSRRSNIKDYSKDLLIISKRLDFFFGMYAKIWLDVHVRCASLLRRVGSSWPNQLTIIIAINLLHLIQTEMIGICIHVFNNSQING